MKETSKDIAYFSVSDILPIAMTLLVTAIAASYGLSVMDDVKKDNCESGNTYDDGNCYTCDTSEANYTFVAGNNTCYNGTDNIAASMKGDVAFNGSYDGALGTSKFPAKIPLIATVVIAAVVIGILMRYMFVRFG